MANKRTYWAIQALGTHVSDGSFTVATAKFVPGVQSVGITTNYNLEQTFQLGQLEIYQDIEEVPDIEISVEKVLDQTTALYGRVMDPADPTKVEIVADQNNQVDIAFVVHPDTDKTVGDSNATAVAHCSGMYCSSASFNFATDGYFTESISLVGNHKVWTDTPGAEIAGAPDSSTLDTGAVGKRQHFVWETAPEEINNLTTAADTTNELVVTNVSVSVDFGREQINMLGKRMPYHRYVTFPVEVTTDIEALVTDIADMDGTQAYPNIDNLAERTIKFSVFDGAALHPKSVPAGTARLHTFDLGTKNKITSITWNGIDTGGSNASMTFSYRNFNKLDYIFGSSDGSTKGTDVPYPT